MNQSGYLVDSPRDLLIDDTRELLDVKNRQKLLEQHIHALERGKATFPVHMYRVVELGNIYGIPVKEDASCLCLEWPIQAHLEPSPTTPGEVQARYSVAEFAVNWMEVRKRHVIYTTVGPAILRPMYLKYLQGFRVSQLGAAANAQTPS